MKHIRTHFGVEPQADLSLMRSNQGISAGQPETMGFLRQGLSTFRVLEKVTQFSYMGAGWGWEEGAD